MTGATPARVLITATFGLLASIAPAPALGQESGSRNNAQAPNCMHAALALVLGTEEDDGLVRRLPKVLPSKEGGASPFDVLLALDRLGVAVLVGSPSPNALSDMMRRGIRPVHVAETEQGRHAVVLDADPNPGVVRVMEASAGSVVPRPLQELVDPTTSPLLLVVGSDIARLQPEAALEMAAYTRRFRAEGWLRMALRHGRVSDQSLYALRRAAEADPSWDDARRLLQRFAPRLPPAAAGATTAATSQPGRRSSEGP